MKKQFPIFLTLFFAFLFFQNTLFAQRDYSKVEIKAEQVADNIYMLTGSGGNIGVVVGDDGVFMIDSQFGPLSEKITAAIGKLSSQPIKYLFNTHWHGDHTGGNENFGKKGAIIVAHENVKNRMSTEQIRPFRRSTPAAAKIAQPVITFKNGMQFHLNGEDILIYHFHYGHTDGDAFVYFPKSNVIHMGDNFFKGRFPYIDLGSGGSVEGALKNINEVLFLADSETKIIPGHGALANKKDLMEYRDVIMIARDRVKKAIDKGMTLEEIKTSNVTKEYDEEWGGGFINPEKFVEILHADLTRDDESEVTKKEEKK